MKCISCNSEISDSVNFCPECGAKVIRVKYCSQCGTKLHSNVKFCHECGAPIEEGKQSETSSLALNTNSEVDKKYTKQELYDLACEEIKNNEYEPAIDKIRTLVKEYDLDPDESYTYNFTAAIALNNQADNIVIPESILCGSDEYNDLEAKIIDSRIRAEIAIDRAMEFADTLEKKCDLLYEKSRAEISRDSGGPRKYIIGAMESPNDEKRLEYRKAYVECTEALKSICEKYANSRKDNLSEEEMELLKAKRFTNFIKPEGRKYLFITKSIDTIAGLYDETGTVNWVFTMDYIPSDLVIPNVTENTLYVMDNSCPEKYFPCTIERLEAYPKEESETVLKIIESFKNKASTAISQDNENTTVSKEPQIGDASFYNILRLINIFGSFFLVWLFVRLLISEWSTWIRWVIVVVAGLWIAGSIGGLINKCEEKSINKKKIKT